MVLLIAVSKLSSVNDLVSKALTDEKVSDEEFQVILSEMESYKTHKSQIRRRVRNQLSSEKEEEIREEAEKKGVLKSQENGYEQPPEYAEACRSTLDRFSVHIACCSYN